MKEMIEKAKNLNEPDDIMLMDESDFIKAYDVDIDEKIEMVHALETKINDLAFQKEELLLDNKNITDILNNEALDHIRANELFDEIKYNQIEILKIESELSKLKKKYDALVNDKDEIYSR